MDPLTGAGMIPRVWTKCNDYPSRMPTRPSHKSATADAALGRALALVRDLRARCPWDRAQTRETLRPYLVEEALELDQALRHDEPAALRDELRSEEHTSELQSRLHLACRLLLE